ncbi:hypothetical protein [Lysinibacillus fusiformis]|uniref:hypothetical protein n=1 Tax=Lysinibacillus fusiformis TaxID=28031 RepID=UPI000507B06F|nr:hypothetical protein [Lysinibacillus fusiformis]KGA83736.1 hypothetical protein KQ41_06775 [Lysinibacillus fusiformis]UXJ71421.1 hypothetical protein N5069_23650 [Lysinibacillus fusiformis]
MYLKEKQIGEGDRLEFNLLFSRLIAIKLIETELKIDCSEELIEVNVSYYMQYDDFFNELHWFLKTAEIGDFNYFDDDAVYRLTFSLLNNLSNEEQGYFHDWKENLIEEIKENEFIDYLEGEVEWISFDTLQFPLGYIFTPMHEVYSFFIDRQIELQSLCKRQ